VAEPGGLTSRPRSHDLPITVDLVFSVTRASRMTPPVIGRPPRRRRAIARALLQFFTVPSHGRAWRAADVDYDWRSTMRVRIISAMSGQIDGIDLTRFQVASVYEVGTSLANYLMAAGCAEPALNEPHATGESLREFSRPHRPDQAADPKKKR
jgi:hypothetical protein